MPPYSAKANMVAGAVPAVHVAPSADTATDAAPWLAAATKLLPSNTTFSQVAVAGRVTDVQLTP